MSHDCDIYWARRNDLDRRHLALLDDLEVGRREAYMQEEDRARFTLAAVMLRLVVSRRLGVRPGEVLVDRTCETCGKPHGRPRLPGTRFHLSVTHSGDFAAFAVTTAGPVGVDLEVVRSFDHQPLLDEVLAPEECDGDTSLGAFFTYWTRKESVLKATGAGLSIPMTQLVVTPPTQPPRLLRYPGISPTETCMTDISPAAGYAGAATVLAPEPVGFREHDGGALLRDHH